MLELFDLLDDLESVFNTHINAPPTSSAKPSNNRQELAYSKWKREQEGRSLSHPAPKRVKRRPSPQELATRLEQCLAGYCCKHNSLFDPKSKSKCPSPCAHQCYWNPTGITDWHLCHTQLTLPRKAHPPPLSSCACDKNRTYASHCDICRPELFQART